MVLGRRCLALIRKNSYVNIRQQVRTENIIIFVYILLKKQHLTPPLSDIYHSNIRQNFRGNRWIASKEAAKNKAFSSGKRDNRHGGSERYPQVGHIQRLVTYKARLAGDRKNNRGIDYILGDLILFVEYEKNVE